MQLRADLATTPELVPFRDELRGWLDGHLTDEFKSPGVRGAPGQRGPRVHDLRHSFAVHQLVAWYRDGGDVQARLPLLATYMGHVCLGSTQVYLDITAELLHEAGRRFQAPPLAIALGDR